MTQPTVINQQILDIFKVLDNQRAGYDKQSIGPVRSQKLKFRYLQFFIVGII
jgi:hypothetical protein